MVGISSKIITLTALFAVATCGIIPKKQGLRPLVLLDNWATIETHSIFFEQLRQDGHSI
jgi:hypothetical protein